MLILTDSPQQGDPVLDGLARSRSCQIVDLAQSRPPAAKFTLLVADVDVTREAAAIRLAAALTQLRPHAAFPLLFLARDDSPKTAGFAQAVGASEIVERAASPALIAAIAQRLIEDHQSRLQKPALQGGETLVRALGVKAALAGALDAASRGEAIGVAEVEKGADLVLNAVKQTPIRNWLDVVRQFDDVTYQHCLLVAGLVAALSVKLNLTLAHQQLLSQAALIHDVGKARIPAAILNKPGKLTDAEMAVMRTHAALGHEMLTQQGGFHPVILDVARHHHETLDGEGYPDRLRGAQISGYVRIVTICDIYAALIERRPYKSPMAAPQALGVLARMGAKLDAEMLATFKTMIAAG